MRTVVVGAGAIGSAIAAGLVIAGRDVTLVARGSRLTELAARPLELEREGEVRYVPVPVSGWSEFAGPADLAFLCTKTLDLSEALHSLKSKLVPDGTVVTLQNGVEAHEQAAACLPMANIVAGRVHGFFEMDGLRARHVGVSGSILFGCTRGDAAGANAAVEAVLLGSGFGVERSADVVRSLWEKMLISACAGGVACAFDMPVGRISDDVKARPMLRDAMQEVVALAAARATVLDAGIVQQMMDFVARFPPEATTSLQRDLAAGRPSEYDALVGVILRMAREYSVPHPTFLAIDRAVRSRAGDP